MSITTYYQLVASSDNHGLPLPSTFHALHNARYPKLCRGAETRSGADYAMISPTSGW